MTITELMINDIVSVVPSGLQICIAAIHNKKVAYYGKGGLNWVKLSLIRPIPVKNHNPYYFIRRTENMSNEELLKVLENYMLIGKLIL